MTLFTDAIEALGRKTCGGRLWISSTQILQYSLRLFELLEFVIGVTKLEHRIRHLVAARVVVHDLLEIDDADILIDSMRGRYTVWYRIRVNLRSVPTGDRPPAEVPDPNYDPWSE